MKKPMKNALRLLVALAACHGGAQAAPGAPQVVAGQATFTQQGNVFSITNTPGAIIHWDSFSVGAGEVTRFIQQSGDSAVLNRVVGQDPSRILGALQSNGHVFLINPNGILFGKDARVDVAGLTASTLDIANADFLAGKRSFKAGNQAGAIANQGSIATPSGGKVYLIAPSVENSGVITTPQGQVVLAAGRSLQLVESNNPDLHVVVSAPQDSAVNLGQVVAQAGRIGIYGALVRQKGALNADSAIVGANGRIVLKASGDAMLEAGSVTSATGAGKGGDVHVLGQRVGITGNAQVDASGAQGGGTVLAGGGYQGKNPLLPNARQTLFGKDASIRADALQSGAGGKVVLWADGATRAFGRISARGGALGGDGGLVETSGSYLDIAGLRVDAGAARGRTGTWLLDPFDIEITSEPSDDTLANADQFSEGGDESTTLIEADELSSLSTSANVVLQARNNVTFNGAFARRSGTSGSLTVEAGNSITVNTAIDTKGGALTLKANVAPYANGETPGNVILNNTIDTGGGKFAASGRNVILNGTGQVTAGEISIGAANSVEMQSGSALKSGGYIDIVADNAALAGTIGAASVQLPMVSLRPFSKDRPINIVNSDGGGLHLSPAELTTIAAHSINIGSTASSGAIHVASALPLIPAVTRNLVLETQGPIWVDAPIVMHPGTGGNLLLNITGTLGSTIMVGSGGGLSADNIRLRADNMTLGGTLTNANVATGTIDIAPANGGTGIQLGGSLATASPYHLMLNDAELANLSGGSHITIGGNDGQYGDVDVSGLSMLTGTVGSKSLALLAGDGNLLVSGNLSTDRKLRLQGNRIDSAALTTVQAPSIALEGRERIGSAGAALRTATSYLSATNRNPGGTSPINIHNFGTLSLGNVLQEGAGNNGAVGVLNEGGMTLPADSMVRAEGTVSLRTRSPLTIAGLVATGSGAVTLEAGNGGVLTVAPGGSVQSGGGIAATGGSIVNNGSLATTSGTITTTGPVSGSGTITLPNSGPPAGPTLGDCVADPALSGCANVLPTFSACLAAPGTPGCSAVLPSAATCAAAPTTPGCAAVKPTVESCTVTPSAPGCAAVLPTLDACIAAPATPGCSAVLPSPAVCSAAPNTPGCAPTIDVCVAKPATPGCGAVLPTLDQCVANPAAAGCSVVLPSLGQCSATPSTPGCQAVLPTIAQCILSPSAQGCQAVLPTLDQCVANPARQGCGVVLPSLQTCTATPSAPGCGVVLPTLSACVAAPTTAGCPAVLPTLSQCVDSPTLQGCGVVLPPVDACVANPSAPGCVVVAPPREAPAGSPMQQASATAVNLINQASDNAAGMHGAGARPPGEGGGEPKAGRKEDRAEGGNTPAVDSNNQGGKSAKLVKTYCN